MNLFWEVSMSKRDDIIFTLKKDFSNGLRLDEEGIYKKYNFTRATFFRYKKLLAEQDFFLEKDKNTGFYYHPASDYSDIDMVYEPLTRDIVKEYAILSRLSRYKHGKTRMEIMKLFSIDSKTSSKEHMEDEDEKGIHIEKSKFYELINSMILNGFLLPKDGNVKTLDRNTKYIVNTDYVNLSIENDDKLYDFLEYIPYNKRINNKALSSLRKKIYILTGQSSNNEFFDENIFIQYGRGYRAFEDFEQYKRELIESCFDTNKIEFDYTSNSNKKPQHVRFSTGLAVYSQDKDILYLIGKHRHAIEIYNYAYISNLHTLNEENLEYGKKEYSTLFNKMFSISSDTKEHEICIEFKYTIANWQKLIKLANNRPSSSLVKNETTITYTDSVYGLPDFLAFLRSFGSDYKVKSCKSEDDIKKRLLTTINQTFERYGKESNS